MQLLLISIAATVVCLVLACTNRRLPRPIRGLLLGGAIGWPVAFTLVFLRIVDGGVPITGVYVTTMIWLPFVISVLGVFIAMLMTGTNKEEKSIE